MRKTKLSKIMRACRDKKLIGYAEEYLRLCEESERSGGKKKEKRFPNVAGFCRYMKVGAGELDAVRESYPEQYDALLAIFEDEALNSDVSSALIGSYLKKRLGYSERDEKESAISVLFEHDVIEDGG